MSSGRAGVALLETSAGRATEEITLVESGGGRVLVVTADCPSADYDAYAPWFAASLASVRNWA